ncbi:BREX-1 system adenine-specific DNA-methyltransferase PglX [Fusobacterium sp.]|uniref:BREX-1 system adenine-specific DNA-methyltransferase PglX n=1 Tax=Fusobacterium sp. TaxID=68766 RepID=UPI00396C6954
MDKASLKIFATEARIELMQKVVNKLSRLGIDKKGIKTDGIKVMGKEIEVLGYLYPITSYNELTKRYNAIGYDALVEECAYSWFNRLVALAYMEINGYIEEGVVFSSGTKREPDILDNYYNFDFFNNLDEEKKNRIHKLREAHDLEPLYPILVEEKCRDLADIMPFMFDKNGGYLDILFPEGMLMKESFLEKLTTEFKKNLENGSLPAEIIGWLYQHYNSDFKDQVFAELKKNKKITKEKIAPATQLFTPHWIVKYMAENSVGKLAIESCGVDPKVKENWKYFITNSEDTEKERVNIESIKIIDPAMGSGHMLTYSFDLLANIYENLGWSTKEAVFSILKNNLYGLEIDKRAAQLASFAILMKGREKFPRLFKALKRMDEEFSLNTLYIEESNGISSSTREMIKEHSLLSLGKLIDNFEDASEYGSILKLEKLEIEELKKELEQLKAIHGERGQLSLTTDAGDFISDYELLEKLITQQKIMSDKYDVVITNPPYMGGKSFDEKLKSFVEKNYKDVKSDLFSVFIEKCREFTKKDGYTSMITMQSWMFLSSYDKLRKSIIEETEIQNLVHLGARAFEEIGGEVVQTVSWVSKNKKTDINSEYIRLVDYNNALTKEEEFFNKKNYYIANQKEFEKIPGSPIAYWVSDNIINCFNKYLPLIEIEPVKAGLTTGNNELYLKIWFEVQDLNFDKAVNKYSNFEKKWYSHPKGGSFRKWYGNYEYVINWQYNGKEIKDYSGSTIRNEQYYFDTGICWSQTSSSSFSARYLQSNTLINAENPTIYVKNKDNLLYYLGYMNTKIVNIFMTLMNPTLHYLVGDVSKLPIKLVQNKKKEINALVQQNIDIAKEEWDSRETSWDFKKLFIAQGDSIEKAYDEYCKHWTENFVQMHKNEEELNKIFIDIYDLNDEMDNIVPFEDITLLKNEAPIANEIDGKCEYLNSRGASLKFSKEELVKQFLSYAIGCIMGRYSIDKEGLIIANSDDVLENGTDRLIVKDKDGNIRHEIINPRFYPDEFGIIPVTGENVFENDIVSRVCQFVKALYGEKKYEENMYFICDALGKKSGESYDDVLRKYFIKDFYKDHLKRYQKRPIYWMLNSGKKDGFSAFVYMHRYTPMTIARIRTEYLIPYQEKMENLKKYYERIAIESTEGKEKKSAEKKLKELYDILNELKDYANNVKYISEKNIPIDLDDGVKVNYEKFDKIMMKI